MTPDISIPDIRTAGFSAHGLHRLGTTLRGYVERGEVPGLVSMVHRRGVLASVDTAGWRDRDDHAPMRRDTIVRIASMTKPIVATAALTLVDDATLRLHDPVEDWLPELSARTVLRDPHGRLDDVVPASRPITLADLLTNRAGWGWGRSTLGPSLLALTAQPIAAALGLSGTQTLGPDAWLRRLAQFPLIAQPGALWRYHTCSDILGVLIARATGRPLETALRERIFEPLAMPDTSFTVPRRSRERLSVLYGPAPDFAVLDHPRDTAWSTEPVFPSGGAGLVSTADDYLRFARMLLRGGTLDGVRVLSSETVAAMTTDRLTPAQRADPPFAPPVGRSLWAEHGFGYGLRIRVHDTDVGPGAGTLSWPGGLGTAWFADPTRDLTAVLLLQSQNMIVGADWRSPIGPHWRNLIYEALTD